MIVADGLAIRGCTRTGATASPGSQFQFPSYDDEVFDASPGQGFFDAGDLSILSDCVQNTSATIPTLVIPTGFTSLHGLSGTEAGGNGMRAHLSYRIWDTGTLRSDILTGMNGAAKNRKNLMTFRMSRPVQSVSLIDSGSVFSTGNPASITMNAAGEAGNILVCGWAHGENPVTSWSFSNCIGSPHWIGSNSQAADSGLTAEGGANFIRSGYSYYPVGSTPANSVIDMTDFGDFNVLMGLVLRLT